MINEQQHFFKILDFFPKITIYWDKSNGNLDIQRLEHDLNILSSGESALARFLGGVWLGNNQFNFDIFSHPKSFNEKEMKVFKDWINNPFYP